MQNISTTNEQITITNPFTCFVPVRDFEELIEFREASKDQE